MAHRWVPPNLKIICITNPGSAYFRDTSYRSPNKNKNSVRKDDNGYSKKLKNGFFFENPKNAAEHKIKVMHETD